MTRRLREDALLANFERNVRSVYDLMNFDRAILDLVIAHLRTVDRRHSEADIQNPRLRVSSVLQMLQNVRDNDSLRTRYAVVFNQCVVLLVSHFGASLRAMFERELTAALRGQPREELASEAIRISVGELANVDTEMPEFLARTLPEKKDLSFQDMRSVARAFEHYVGYAPPKNRHVNNIIVAQACRHSVVHNAGSIDDRLRKQIEAANPRDLLTDIDYVSRVQFQPDDVQCAAESMTWYLTELSENIINGNVV